MGQTCARQKDADQADEPYALYIHSTSFASNSGQGHGNYAHTVNHM